MDINKFTTNSQQALQAAQAIAFLPRTRPRMVCAALFAIFIARREEHVNIFQRHIRLEGVGGRYDQAAFAAVLFYDLFDTRTDIGGLPEGHCALSAYAAVENKPPAVALVNGIQIQAFGLKRLEPAYERERCLAGEEVECDGKHARLKTAGAGKSRMERVGANEFHGVPVPAGAFGNGLEISGREAGVGERCIDGQEHAARPRCNRIVLDSAHGDE